MTHCSDDSIVKIGLLSYGWGISRNIEKIAKRRERCFSKYCEGIGNGSLDATFVMTGLRDRRIIGNCAYVKCGYVLFFT